jgi:hypothetical protein
MVVRPSHPVPGAFLQVNELSSSCRVGVLDPLLGDAYYVSAGRSNPVYLGRRLVAHIVERPLNPISHLTHGDTRDRQKNHSQNCKLPLAGTRC